MLILALGLLAGCREGDSASDPAAQTTTATPTSPTDSASGSRFATVVHETAAGGEVGPVVRLDSARVVDEFVAQFTRAGLGEKIRAELEVRDLRPGDVMVGRVVAIGCDVPQVLIRDAGELLVAQPVPKSTHECFAPMTSVALAPVSQDEVPQPTGGE